MTATLTRPQTRARAISWARDMIARNALVVDTETLGTDHDAGLCDLAIVSLAGVVVFDSLINPGKPIPADATAVHGIDDAMVAAAPVLSEIYRDLVSVLDGRAVVAYNAPFDAGCLNACYAAIGYPPIAEGWECAMRAFSDFDGTIDTRFRSSRWGRDPTPKLKWWRLGDAAATLGIEANGAHRALADAETTRRLIVAMAEAEL